MEADKFGTSIVGLAGIKGVFKGTFEESEGAINKFRKTINDAASGDSGARKNLLAAGLDPEKLINADLPGQLRQLTEAVSGASSAGEKFNIVTNAAGKTGAELIPVLSQGTQKFDEVTQRFQRNAAGMVAVQGDIAGTWDGVTKGFKQFASVVAGVSLNAITGGETFRKGEEAMRRHTEETTKAAAAQAEYNKLQMGNRIQQVTDKILQQARAYHMTADEMELLRLRQEKQPPQVIEAAEAAMRTRQEMQKLKESDTFAAEIKESFKGPEQVFEDFVDRLGGTLGRLNGLTKGQALTAARNEAEKLFGLGGQEQLNPNLSPTLAKVGSAEANRLLQQIAKDTEGKQHDKKMEDLMRRAVDILDKRLKADFERFEGGN